MSNNNNLSTKTKVFVSLSYFFASCLVIAGIVLVAVFYNNFIAYIDVSNGINARTHGYGTLELIASYNTRAITNDWTIASIDEFAPGLTMLIVGVVSIAITVWLHLKKKSNDLEPKVKKIKVRK